MPVGDNTDPSDGPSDPVTTQAWYVSELLCFVKDKCNAMPVDDLVKICADFYSEAEIIDARNLIDSTGVRMQKRTQKSADRLRHTVEDIVKCVLNPTVKLPEFHAKNLARLPPVDIKHVDTAAILVELRSLRAEVRNMGQLKSELDELKSTVAECRKQIADLQAAATHSEWHRSTTASLDEFPPLSTTATRTPQSASTAGGSMMTKSSRIVTSNSTKKPAKQPVIGVSTRNQVKSVITRRTVDIFVSRLHPATSDKELIDCAQESADSGNIKLVDVTCVQLKAKYEYLYSSFHIALVVESQQFRNAIDLYMSPEAWPSGVLVKRFFKPKDESAQP